MQRQAKKRSGDAGGAGGTKRAVTPRSAFIVLACTAIAEYFAFYLRLADAGAKAGIPHGGYVMCFLTPAACLQALRCAACLQSG